MPVALFPKEKKKRELFSETSGRILLLALFFIHLYSQNVNHSDAHEYDRALGDASCRGSCSYPVSHDLYPVPNPSVIPLLYAQVELNGEDIVFKLDEHLTSVSAITDGFETFDAELSEVRAATLDLLVSFAFKCLRAILFRSSLF